MVNIYKNFIELSQRENFLELKLIYNKLITSENAYKKFFDESAFYKIIDIEKLKSFSIEEIDHFIKKRLLFYPNFYPHIVKSASRNYKRSITDSNDNHVKNAKKSLKKQEILAAITEMLLKKHVKDEIEEFSFFFDNGEKKFLFKKTAQLLYDEVTIQHIFEELEIKLIDIFCKDCFNEDIIKIFKDLAMLMACEIYFRAKKPHEYCVHFLKSEEQYDKLLLQQKKYILKNKVAKIYSNRDPEKDIEENIENNTEEAIKVISEYQKK